MKTTEAADVIDILAAAYPNVVGKMSQKQAAGWAQVYAAGIMDLDFAQCQAAVNELIKSSEWLSIAKIRSAVISVTRGQQRSGAEAWEDVLKQVSAVGTNGRPVFADPIVAHCVRGLGWREICQSENQVSDRARFIDAYDELTKQGRISAQVSRGAAGPALPSRRPEYTLMEPEKPAALPAAPAGPAIAGKLAGGGKKGGR